jgi:GNAT superfamily N-acetyltransferase
LKPISEMIRLIDYEDKHQPDFKRLNMEWLEKYGLLESHDLEILDDPRGTVLDRGGAIFLAVDGDKVIGTAGLWKENEETYELIKMFVDTEYRGQGISKLLLDHCLAEARKTGAKKVLLFSNSQLQTALKLYGSYGFRHVAVTDAPFVTADVKMELVF